MNQEENTIEFDMDKVKALPDWKMEDGLQTIALIAVFAAEFLGDDVTDAERRLALEGISRARDKRPPPLKNHEVRELVNKARDVAKEFHNHQSLRDRLAYVLLPSLQRPIGLVTEEEPSTEALLKMIGENTGKRINLGLDDLDQYLSVARAAIKLSRTL
jgi:hypothetical protein